MKEKYICKECGEIFEIAENLSKHIKHHNINNKQYYDKWCKHKNEGICLCGNSTKFIGITKGYRKYCSIICKNKQARKIYSLNCKYKKEIIKENLKFECLECQEKFKTKLALSKHIHKKHNIKIYYDKYLKKENENLCRECGNETKFTGKINGKYAGYEMCCSNKCREIYKLKKRTNTNLIKYNVKNVFQDKNIKMKIKKSFKKRYGINHNMKSEEGKKQYKKSMKLKYGIEWPLQDSRILYKNLKSARLIHHYKDTNLTYQGSYELDFLEKYYEKFKTNLNNGPSIKYKYKNQNKVYHSDFYIKSLNLIVEIKSSWTLKLDEEIEYKKKYCINNKYNYIMILDKDYNEFNLLF